MKKFLQYFISCFFVFSAFTVKAEALTRDSMLLRHYNDLCGKYEYESADSLLKYANLQLQISIQCKSEVYQAKAYTSLGVAYARLYEFNEALTNYLKARDIIESSKCTDVSATLGQIGYIYLRLNRKRDAYKYFKLQETTSLKEENYASYLSCVVNLYDFYNTVGQIDSAFVELNKGLVVSRKYHVREKEAIILDNIANYYFTKALESNDPAYFKKVELYADTALQFHSQDKDSAGIYFIYGLLGAVNTKTKNYTKAEQYYNSYLSYSMRTEDIFGLTIATQEMADMFAVQKKFEKAYYFRRMYDSINKQYIDKEVNEQVQELNTKYGTEKKEQENKLLLLSNEKKQMGIYYALAGCVLLGGLVLLVFRSYSQKKKANILISKQKEEVENQKVEIGHQKELIEEKQKEIVDSIHYAKRIQNTLMTHQSFLNEHLPENFVFFKPKDIVSGDFYWATLVENKFYLAVCDSTGHGVPGAFMSLLNIGFLSEAINEKRILKPNEILNYARTRLVNSISKDGQQDGFDGILLCIDKSTNEITYAAANNSPIIISGNDITELDGDRMPVGIGEFKQDFKLYTITREKNAMLYLYTDGYADQFGGPKGKKFKYKALNELLLSISKNPLSEQKNVLYKRFEEWKGKLEQVDDVCIIGVKI